jgi:hypothetical protein
MVCFLPPMCNANKMKLSRKILTGISFATIVGLVVYLVRRYKEAQRMSEQIAEQGYETAHDILFPLKSKGKKKKTAHS